MPNIYRSIDEVHFLGYRFSMRLLSTLPLLLGIGCHQPNPEQMEEGQDDSGRISDTSNGDDNDAQTEGGSEGADNDGEPFDEYSSYYPMVDGATWVYATENAQSQRGPSERTGIVADEDHELKTTVFRLIDEADINGESSSSVLVRNGTKSMRVHKSILVDQVSVLEVDYDPGFVRFDEAWTRESEGFSVELEYTRTADDSPTSEIRRHRFTVYALHDEVTVPAGTFDCIRIRRERLTGMSAGELVDFWYAKGVGKIKEHRLSTGKLELLDSYSIPGSDSGK